MESVQEAKTELFLLMIYFTGNPWILMQVKRPFFGKDEKKNSHLSLTTLFKWTEIVFQTVPRKFHFLLFSTLQHSVCLLPSNTALSIDHTATNLVRHFFSAINLIKIPLIIINYSKIVSVIN